MDIYSFNARDYYHSTIHLSLEEDAVYRRLLDFYYETESPIPLDLSPVIRRLRLGGLEDLLGSILEEFFSKRVDGWHNAMADKTIKSYKAKRNNGGKGGRPRKKPQEPQKSPVSDSKDKIDTEVAKKEKKPSKAKNAPINFDAWPEKPSDDQWKAIKANRTRKKAANTQRAIDMLGREVRKCMDAGFSFKSIMDEWEYAGWIGVKADWIRGRIEDKKGKGNKIDLHNGFKDKVYEGTPFEQLPKRVRDKIEGMQ